MNGSGPLDFDATIDQKQFNLALDQMINRIKGVGDQAEKEGSKIDQSFRNAAAAVTAYFSLSFAKNMVTGIGQVRGEFQQLEIALETILKNKEKSDALMKDIVQFAAITPFDLKGVASGAKQLLAYGTSAEDIIPTMRRLGDVAAGLSIPFGDLVYLYGTSATQGRIMTKNLMQFANRGIPIIEELSKTLNVSKADVLDLAGEGVIGFELLEEVIFNLTETTGMFGGMMEKQSASITGLASNLGDAWEVMLNNIGEANQSTYEGALKIAIDLVENYEAVLDILKVLVATYGTYRAAVILNTVAMKGYSKALGLAAIKQNLLNLAQKASPWGLALAGVTALVGGLWVYNRAVDDAGEKLAAFNDTINESVGKAEALFDAVKRSTAGTEERKQAIQRLQSKYPDYLKNIDLEKAGLQEIETAQKGVSEQIIKTMALEQAEVEKAELYKKKLAIIKLINEEGVDYNDILAKRKQDEDTFLATGRNTMTFYGDIVDTYLINIAALDQQINEVDKTYGNIAKNIYNSLAEFAIETVEKNVVPEETKKTFAQSLSEIQQMYENYYRWAENYGKDSADQHFKNLVSGGQSFLEYLEKEISKYESKAKKTSTDRDNLSVLLATKDDVLGNKTQIDAFKEQIDQAKEEYRDLIDYIEFLKRTIESQGEWDGSEHGLQKLNILYEALNSAQKEFIRTSEATYKQVTSDAADFAKRRIDIEQEYQDTVRKLDQSSLGSERYDEAIAAAEKIKDEKLKIITEEEVKSTEAYRRISQQIGRLTRNEAEKYIKSLRQQLTTLDDQSELYQEILKLIRDVEQGIKDQNIESLLKASDALRDGARFAALFDENLAAIIDTAAQVGEGIAKIASGDVLSGSLQVATSVFSSIINASDNAARKAEERQQRILDALQERLSVINELLTRQIDLIDRLTGTDKLKGFSDGFRDLGFEISKLLKQINEIDVHKSYNGHHYDVDLDDYIKTFEEIFGRRIGRTETFSSDIIERLIDENQQAISSLYKEILRGDLTGDKAEELKLLIEALEQQTEQFEDLKNDYNEFLTGSTAASIIDSIASGFEQGKTSAEDFADTFEELMRKAMLQALKMKALEGPLTAWYEDFAKLSEDGLTSEELEQLKNAYDYIISNASEQWEELQNILDQGNELQADTSLTGAIKGVSQETASLIAGQMNAIRMNQAQSLVSLNNMLEKLSGIEYNTRNNAYIKSIYELLQTNSSDGSNSIRANGGF